MDDPQYDPLQMWRGPTWVNINYLFVEGLERIGQDQLARDLRRRTLDLMLANDDIYEYYHPETGEIPPKAAPIFGWSSAVFIEMAIQESAALAEDTPTASYAVGPISGGTWVAYESPRSREEAVIDGGRRSPSDCPCHARRR